MGGGRWWEEVGRWEVGGEVGVGGLRFGLVRSQILRFDTILGESIVETAMGTMLRRNPTALRLPPLTACLCRPQCYRRAA